MNDRPYADIFDEPLDPPFVCQVEQIEEIYNASELPAQLSWPRLQLQMRQQRPVSRKQRQLALNWMRPRPRSSRRLALIAALLVFVLLLSGFAYATINLGVLGNLLYSEPASQQLLLANQFTTLNQSRTVDGYRVTLDKAYADANRVILGFIVTYPTGINRQTWDTSFIASDSDAIKLKTPQGQVLPLLGNQESLDTGNPKAGKEGVALAFDGAGIAGSPAQISLDLSLGVTCNTGTPPRCQQTLTYDFTLPFHPGRSINLHQVVSANGHALALERVVVTPSETRLYIHWQKDDLQPPPFRPTRSGLSGPASYTQTLYDLQLSVGGRTYHICQFVADGSICPTAFGSSPYPNTSQSISDAGGGYTGPILLNGDQQTRGISLFQPLSAQHGSWTLTITKFDMTMKRDQQGHYGSSAPASKDNAATPWVFTFMVP